MKKMIERFVQKAKEVNADFIGNTEEAKLKLPLLDLTFIPVGVLVFYFKQFLRLAAIFAVPMMILSFASSQSFMCNIPQYSLNESFSCASSPALYIVFYLLRLLIVVLFLKSWYQVVVEGKNVEFKEMFVFRGKDWKLFSAFILLISSFLMPILSVVILLTRQPNPDWIIESAFFAVVSIGFFIPFIGLRFYSYFAFILGGYKLPSIADLWRRTAGNGLKLLLSISIVLVLAAVLFVNYVTLAKMLLGNNLFFGAIIVEYFYDILFLAISGLFINHCVMQQGLLFSQDEK